METATQALQRLTSYGRYDPDRFWDPPVDDPRVVRDHVVNDLDRLPWFHKGYADGLPSVALPRDLPTTRTSAVGVLAGTADVEARDPDLTQLSRILHLSAGVVRTSPRPSGTWLFRAAGSTGARFPLEVYVAVPEGGALPAGVHWYHPREHALVRIGPAPAGGAPTVVVNGAPRGATASAGTGTCTGTRARCSRSSSRSPTRPASRRTCGRGSRTRR